MFKMFSDYFGWSKQISAVEKRVDAAEAHQHALLRNAGLSKARLDKQMSTIETMQNRFSDQREKAMLELKQARVDIERLEEALASSRDELRTAKELTIPGLIASHEVLVSRWEAETKIAVMRGALAETPRREE
jgi:hypothetical protein